MRIKVTKSFRLLDTVKKTKATLVMPGQIINVSDERGENIINSGWGKRINNFTKPDKIEIQSPKKLLKLKISVVRDMCTKLKIPFRNTDFKKVLIDKLMRSKKNKK